MLIVVPVAVEVDPKEWHAVYGNGDHPIEVRKDVREYVLNAIQASAGMEESGAQVSLRVRVK